MYTFDSALNANLRQTGLSLASVFDQMLCMVFLGVKVENEINV